MIIDLSKSKLFTVAPDVRFAREYQLPKGIWTELWRRYKLLAYEPNELCEYLQIKTGKQTNERRINRWIARTEIYSIAFPYLKKGGKYVNTEIFRDYEKLVLNEFTKHIRFNGTTDSRIII